MIVFQVGHYPTDEPDEPPHREDDERDIVDRIIDGIVGVIR